MKNGNTWERWKLKHLKKIKNKTTEKGKKWKNLRHVENENTPEKWIMEKPEKSCGVLLIKTGVFIF